MRPPLLGRLVSFLLAFYSLSFAGFAAWVFFTFSADAYLPGFRWELTLTRGFTLFMQYLLPVHAAAVAVAASLAGTAQPAVSRGETAPQFGRIVSSTLVVFLLLTAGYTLLSEGLLPHAARRQSDLQYLSRLARAYKAQAEKALQSSDFVTALDAINRYLVVDPGNREMSDKALVVSAGAARQAAARPARPAAPAINPADSAQALFEKAKASFDRRDFFAAHSYAQAAVALDPRRTDALSLAARAWDALGGTAQASDDASRAELFRQKRDAYALLQTNPVAAYYRFQALAAQYPRDTDIRTYFAQAASAMAASMFFIDEAKKLEPLPGTQDILFFNRTSRNAAEAVFIGKMVELPDGNAYFYDIEAIRYDAAGAVAWHFSAPYGKRLAAASVPPAAGGRSSRGSSTGAEATGPGQSDTERQGAILMHAMDRNDARLQVLPVYLQGSRPAGERNILLLAPTVEELRALSSRTGAAGAMSITDLLRMRNDLGAFGLSRPELTIQMALRMVMPFIFLVVSMFAVSLGWGFRARGRLTAFGVALVPLVPVVLAVLTLLYVHAHRVVTGFAVLALGLPAALVALAVLQLLLLAGALVALAGQTTR